jgi:hypothetical protein
MFVRGVPQRRQSEGNTVANRAAPMLLHHETRDVASELSCTSPPAWVVRVGALLLLKTILPRPAVAAGLPPGDLLLSIAFASGGAQRAITTDGNGSKRGFRLLPHVGDPLELCSCWANQRVRSSMEGARARVPLTSLRAGPRHTDPARVRRAKSTLVNRPPPMLRCAVVSQFIVNSSANPRGFYS